jgi:hypothetical protein
VQTTVAQRFASDFSEINAGPAASDGEVVMPSAAGATEIRSECVIDAAADEISVRKNVSRETRTKTSSGPLRSLLEHGFRAEEISCNRLRLAADPPKQTRVWPRNYLTSL